MKALILLLLLGGCMAVPKDYDAKKAAQAAADQAFATSDGGIK
jgi:hypothetical protein